MANILELPTWDLSTYFPSVTSASYLDAQNSINRMIEDGEAMVAKLEQSSASTADQAAALEELIHHLNATLEHTELVESYVGVTLAANSKDEAALAAMSALQPITIRLAKLMVRFTMLVGSLPLDDLIVLNPELDKHRFPLEKRQRKAQRLMSPEEESLAADLSESGATAWARLYETFSSQIEVDVDGERLTMSQVRNLAYHPDGERRSKAYEAELAAWESNALPVAAAMNSIKGAANILSKRRGWESQLEATLFNCNMDRPSLEAMLEAARDSFPMWRRYLRAKAKVLGRPGGLPWYDLFAPVGSDTPWPYDQAQEYVIEGFAAYSDRMADLARRSFRESWIDAGPRRGKQDGAFCAGMIRDESRILMNYEPSFGSVSTLAHELGHAYHNLCLAERSPMQCDIPMTLAETASIFCETIIKRRAIADADPDAKLAILEASLQGSCQVVVDISSRYLFETRMIDGRQGRELSAREMCDLMRQAQLDTYGDGLDADRLHPYMWAAKPHYYSQSAFYNFPYMFGLLFALGLYAIYEQESRDFRARYDQLLADTGMFSAATLAAKFGIDIGKKDFWAGSLGVLNRDIEEFETLANRA